MSDADDSLAQHSYLSKLHSTLYSLSGMVHMQYALQKYMMAHVFEHITWAYIQQTRHMFIVCTACFASRKHCDVCNADCSVKSAC